MDTSWDERLRELRSNRDRAQGVAHAWATAWNRLEWNDSNNGVFGAWYAEAWAAYTRADQAYYDHLLNR